MSELQAHIDGASKGNPGDAGIGFILRGSDGVILEEFSEPIGTATNNEAEYCALLACLERTEKLGVRRLTVHSDSQLLVYQMTGQYAVRHEGLRRFYREACERTRRFDRVEYIYVPRAQNADADALASSAARKQKELRLNIGAREHG